MNPIERDITNEIVNFGNAAGVSLNKCLTRAEMLYFLIDQVNELIDIMNDNGHNIEHLVKPFMQDGTDIDMMSTLTYQESIYVLTDVINQLMVLINGKVDNETLIQSKAYTDQVVAPYNTIINNLNTTMATLTALVGTFDTRIATAEDNANDAIIIANSVSGAITSLQTTVTTLQGLSHNHSNKNILDLTTASYTVSDKTKVGLIDSINASIQSFTTAITALETTKHTHANKTILDGTTASYTVEDQTKLNNVSGNADQLIATHNVDADAHSVKFSGKLDVNNANSMIKDVSYNGTTGVFVFTKYDNTTVTIDIPIEGLISTGYYDGTEGELVLVTSGGAEIRIPASGLVGDYTGETTATIQCVINANNEVSCNIVSNGVTRNLLSVELQTQLEDLDTAKHTHTNKSVLDLIEVAYTTAKDTIVTAMGLAIDGLQANSHTHTNKSILDNIQVAYTTAKDAILTGIGTAISDLQASSHTHSNNTILDNIEVAYTTAKDTILTGIGTAITDLQASSHTHSNKAILDNTTYSFTIGLNDLLTTVRTLGFSRNVTNGNSTANIDDLKTPDLHSYAALTGSLPILTSYPYTPVGPFTVEVEKNALYGESTGVIYQTLRFNNYDTWCTFTRQYFNGNWSSWIENCTSDNVSSYTAPAIANALSSYGVTNGNVAPAYSASSSYGIGAFVRQNNKLYRCSTAIATGEAFNVSKWTQITLIDWMTVQTVATSVSNPTYGVNNSSVLSKVGKTVTFNIFYNNNVAAIPTGSPVIFTLPVGSRPAIPTFVHARCFNNPSTNSVILFVRTDGTVTYDDNITTPLGCYIDGSVSFATNQ